DVALVELDHPVRCGPYVQRACLPDPSLPLSATANCYVSGWGTTSAKAAASPLVLQDFQVHLIDSHTCNGSGWHRGGVHPHNICAGYPRGGGGDTCQGDSGGPLVCHDGRSDRFWLVGVSSWGRGCARAHRPGVYTSTQSFHHWI
ncbi:Acrosin, partial [Cuculus canorus]